MNSNESISAMDHLLRITIVESEHSITENIACSLKESGHNIAGMFSTGEEAVKNVRAVETDLIIMDMCLKGDINGIETAERIMLTQNIPVIFITGQTNHLIVPPIDFTEYYGFLLMPFNRCDLLNIIHLVYGKYIKSINFYRNCRNLILEINPYKIDFIEKVDYLINIFASSNNKDNLTQVIELLYDLKNHLQKFVDPEKVSFILNQKYKRSVYSILGYSDCLLNEIDNMDTEKIKNYISCISIYLKVLFTPAEHDSYFN